VLVTGASGGVGSFAVQIAKAAGAEVTGVCSAAKASAVRSLGADRVLDHRVDDPLAVPADAPARYDVIIDIGGRAPVKQLRRAVTRDGVVVLVGGLGGGKLLAGYERAIVGAMRSPFVPQRIAMLASKEQRADLERLSAMIESGAVVPSSTRWSRSTAPPMRWPPSKQAASPASWRSESRSRGFRR
jgi:NADPH:quinone reductase-like Zn-dependent oxidoreductase